MFIYMLDLLADFFILDSQNLFPRRSLDFLLIIVFHGDSPSFWVVPGRSGPALLAQVVGDAYGGAVIVAFKHLLHARGDALPAEGADDGNDDEAAHHGEYT